MTRTIKSNCAHCGEYFEYEVSLFSYIFDSVTIRCCPKCYEYFEKRYEIATRKAEKEFAKERDKFMKRHKE